MKDGGAVIDAASIDGSLKEWVAWYREVYYGINKVQFIMNSKYKQEVELFEKRIYELEKMNIYLKLAHDVLDSSNSMEGPEIIENISDMTESEKEKKKAEVTIFTAKCNAAIDVVKELEALRIKAERKHREAEKQYEAFCKRNGINNE